MAARGKWLSSLSAAALLLLGAEAYPAARRTAVQASGTVNLNQATAAELDLLPGVGEKAAARILAYRQKKPFRRIEELVQVKGFGKKTFDKLKPHLSIEGPTTLRVERGKAAQGRPAPPAR